MKYIFGLFLMYVGLISFSQTTLDVNSENLHPTICDVLYSDTIRVDYNLLYDTLTYGEMNWKMCTWLINAKIYDYCGNADYVTLPKRFYRNKVIVIYSSEWKHERLFD
jgi:hypothetical protein